MAIAAPVGPVGLLCIRRTLAVGRWAGVVSGLGAATADGLYGCVAGFGLTAISHGLTDHALGLRLLGGLFLCYLGLKTMLAKAPGAMTTVGQPGLLGMYLSTLGLTITNPATILFFGAIFARVGLVAAPSQAGALLLVAGVFSGSMMWWLILSSGVNLLRGKLTQQLHWVNRISGAVLFGFGITALML
jgi:threonine/homoserine/homoserine lactone efflux protein